MEILLLSKYNVVWLKIHPLPNPSFCLTVKAEKEGKKSSGV